MDPTELSQVDQIEMRTQRADGSWSSCPIWVVVLEGDAYVRSAFGRRGAWYRRVLAAGRAEIEVGDAVLRIRLEPVGGEQVNRRVSDVYRAKYAAAWPGPTKTMLGDEARATTMRLVLLGRASI